MDGPILVTGASGYIGSQLIDALLAAGGRVRAMSRDPERLAGLARRGVEVVPGDMLDRRSLDEALRDVGATYYLVHSMAGSGSRHTFADNDRYAAQNFTAAAAHLPQVIYLGGLGRTDDTLSPHLRSRQEVAEILLSGSAPATVLRAGIVIGRGSTSFTMLLSLVRRLPVMITPRWVENRTQPIAIADTIGYLQAALGNPRTYRRSFDIGGPEVLTYREMMQRTAAILGKRRMIVGVPVLTPKLSSYWVESCQASTKHSLLLQAFPLERTNFSHARNLHRRRWLPWHWRKLCPAFPEDSSRASDSAVPLSIALCGVESHAQCLSSCSSASLQRHTQKRA